MSHIVIRNKWTGREYAYPASRYTDLPCVAVESDGQPGQTGFGRGDLVRMVEHGTAVVVGKANFTLAVTYDEVKS